MSLPFTLRRLASAGTTGLVLLSITGCLPAKNPVSIPSEELYVVDTFNQVHEFRFARDAASYDRLELSRLDSFLSRAGIGADDIVSISATGELAAVRQTAVLDALASRGVSARVVADRLTAPDAVVLLVQRPDYLAGRCRPGDIPEVIEGQNLQLAGCANDHNLARMVVDQQDLVHGKPLGPADGEALARGIEAYRAGEIEPLQEETTTGN